MKDTRKLGIRGLLNICPSATFWTDFVHAFGGFSGCLSVWEPSLIYTFLEIQPFLLLTLCNKLKEEMGSFVHTPLINEQVHNFEKVVIDRHSCSKWGCTYTKNEQAWVLIQIHQTSVKYRMLSTADMPHFFNN